MSTKAILTLINLLFTGKKGKKRLKKILSIILGIILLLGAGVSVSGLGSVSAVNTALETIWNALSNIIDLTGKPKDEWLANADAGEILNAMEQSGRSLSAEQEKSMKLAPGNFIYLLRKVDDYEASAHQTRRIKIEGYHEFIEIVTTSSKDENGNTTTETEEVACEEYVYQEITVSNFEIEGLHQIDWRLLYIYALLASLDRQDGGIEQSEVEGNPWLIQKTDIDRAFEGLSMKYDYAFDVLRDSAQAYGFENCRQLPHIESISGDPDTEAGRYTYYYPKSLLNSGSSGFSTLAHTQQSGMVTGIEEVFSKDNFDDFGYATCRFYNYKHFSTLLEGIAGGKVIKQSFDWYIKQAEAGNPVIHSSAYAVNPGSYQINESGRYTFEGQLVPGGNGGYYDGTVGEAAVQLAISRLNWKYSQALRNKIGYWDCSSMIGRIYHELGVSIPTTSTTVSLLKNARAKHQILAESDLQPGDILFFKTQDGIKAGNIDGVGHVVMYAGNGMIIHAASVKSGTVYQSLGSYYNYPQGLILCARPYENVESSYIPPDMGMTQATEIAALEEREAVSRILNMARADARKSNILPSITAAQMILESGFCRSGLAKKSNNCFGMKASLSASTWNTVWDGISVCIMNTKEQDKNGNEYTVSASFRKYPSVEKSLADHSAYLLGAMKGTKLRYPGITAAKNYREAAIIIKAGGYATDVNYVDKLCNIISKYGLDVYDEEIQAMTKK